ncbi:hypothetical protein EB810_05190 [Altererythrobacter sp. FM1]|nr:hypothetical protein EB810_05190 [Altererythrobacter sp. FM1]
MDCHVAAPLAMTREMWFLRHRHPGLEPGSSFCWRGAERISWAPDQVRGDEVLFCRRGEGMAKSCRTVSCVWPFPYACHLDAPTR